MFETLTLPAINRLLRANTWALRRLQPYAGKVAALRCPPFELCFSVLDTGELAAAESGVAPDVTIAVPPDLLLRASARDSTAWTAARVSGNVEFAAAIDYVRRSLRWDYEEDLSRIVGDIAAHRLSSAARQLDLWGRSTARNVSRAVAEYITYEKPLLATAHAIEQFNREVDALRDDVERVEKRLALLGLERSHSPRGDR
jgi:ubiquinone biosynthesis protein UbiJ